MSDFWWQFGRTRYSHCTPQVTTYQSLHTASSPQSCQPGILPKDRFCSRTVWQDELFQIKVEVRNQCVKSKWCRLKKDATQFSSRLSVLSVNFQQMSANPASVVVSMKRWTTNNQVLGLIKLRSVFILAWNGENSISLGLVILRASVRTVLHDVKAEIHQKISDDGGKRSFRSLRCLRAWVMTCSWVRPEVV